MQIRVRAAMLAALLAAALVAPSGIANEKSGPMSSGRQAETTAPASERPASVDTKAGGDVEKLFANTCGWCHAEAGRSDGKGPKLLGTKLSDAEIVHRIKVGKPGAMPGFGATFNGDQMKAIVKYIRELR